MATTETHLIGIGQAEESSVAYVGDNSPVNIEVIQVVELFTKTRLVVVVVGFEFPLWVADWQMAQSKEVWRQVVPLSLHSGRLPVWRWV